MHIEPVEMIIQSAAGTQRRAFTIGSVGGARYASRDIEGTRRSLDAALARGESGTKTNPSIFHIGRYLLTQSPEFEVQGPLTGGEAEIVAILDRDEIFISTGSDQCDRELDPLFQDKPKQMCPHPVASVAWPYSEVRNHWDQLRISSEVSVGPHTVPLQDSPASALVDLEFLLAMADVRGLTRPAFLYCGSVPLLDSVASTLKKRSLPEETGHGVGDSFLARLHDPVLDRAIEHRYRARPVGDDLEER